MANFLMAVFLIGGTIGWGVMILRAWAEADKTKNDKSKE